MSVEVIEVRNLRLWDEGATALDGKPLCVATVVLQDPLFRYTAQTSVFAKDELEAYTKMLTNNQGAN